VIDKTAVNLVWLKRDLRLSDHQPLVSSLKSGLTLLLYVFEPILVDDPHYDVRHWRFVYQSLKDINQQLARVNSKIYVFYGSVIHAFEAINEIFSISNLYSYQEVGIATTYERDIAVKQWCDSHQVQWFESQTAGVIRGKKNRINWDASWQKIMSAPLQEVILTTENTLNVNDIASLPQPELPATWLTDNDLMLKGGELWAHRMLQSFLHSRGKDYQFNVSKPSESRKSCSRLSPYLAWGNISIRQVYQQIRKNSSRKGWKKALSSLGSRLHWHCHFMQKFESEHQMQWRPVNTAYLQLTYPDIHFGLSVETRLTAWKLGRTGYPLVDASMRCLLATGYLNFRMRAMLVSFLCHHLFVDWRLGVHYLAQLFLDFEPGIHYPQFQMQSGITGTNAIRVYNPVKQSIEKDSDGIFLKKWLPELAEIPVEIIHTPWQLSPMEQQLYQCQLGDDYLLPIIDIEETGKFARDLLWGFRKRLDTKKESQRIIKKHVRAPSKKRNARQLKVVNDAVAASDNTVVKPTNA
jgi:deoxyribodipyrimidine photo-lyase